MAIAPSYPSRPSGIGQVRFEQTTASPRWAGSEPVRAGYSVISCDPGMFTVGSHAPHAARAASALWRWRTDAYGTRAPGAKDAESAIMARICEDFNLTPVLARAHYEQMARYLAGTAKCQPSRAGCQDRSSSLRCGRCTLASRASVPHLHTTIPR